MEAVITIVMKYCGEHLDAYGQCVSDHPKDWQTKCADFKDKAANCSNNHPAVKKINHECASEFQAYDKCLKLNSDDVTVCVDVLHIFMNCANKSASRIQHAYTTEDLETKPSV